jgi:hypothetical protein
MAHFCCPPGVGPAGYDVDNKLAPGSVSGMKIQSGESRQVAIWRGSELWIKSNNPPVVPNGIFSREHGELRILTLEGKDPGIAIIETGLGPNRWVSLQVQVTEKNNTLVLPDEVIARPFQPDFVQAAAAEFSTGFVQGATSRLQGALAKTASDKILADPVGFYRGYTSGVLSGLLSGLVELLKTLTMLSEVAQAVSMPNVIIAIVKECVLLITDEKQRELRKMQVERAKQTAKAVTAVIMEIQYRPSVYLAKSRNAGILIGREVADSISTRIQSASPEELGKDVGKVVGRVMFEVIVAVILAVATGGAGDAARAGTLVAEAGEEAGSVARLVKVVGEGLEETPALRRIAAAASEGKALGTKPPIPKGLLSKRAMPPDFKPPTPSELEGMKGIHQPKPNTGVSARAHPKPNADGKYASGALDDPHAGKEVFEPKGALRTGIDATNAEFDVFNDLVHKTGEIGIQSPGHANVKGIDFITANRNAAGEMEIFVNDATINRAKDVKTSMPANWRAELNDALSRLDLGPHSELQAEIAEAAKDVKRIKMRTFLVERTPQGTLRITPMGTFPAF